MKIKKIYIENFGTVSNYSLELKDGVNTVLEDNGWGKSTLAAFIRIMFFGLEGDRSRKSIRDNERNLYRPWNGGTFGGAIEFETAGGSYILTRTFGLTKKDEDTFDLRDAVTKRESSDYSGEDIGRRLFGIDSENYRKTSFVSHDGIKYSGVGSEVGSKVSSAPQAEDLADYDKACELMKNYLNSHSPRSAKGSLSKQKTAIAELKRETERIADVEKRLENEKNLFKDITGECDVLKQKKKLLEDEKKGLLLVREKNLRKKAFLDKKESVTKRENEIKELLDKFGSEKPDEGLISKAEEKIGELSELSVKIETKKSSSLGERFDRLKAKYGDDIPDSDEILGRIEDMNSVRDMIHAKEGIADRIEREKAVAEENRIKQDAIRREKELMLRKKQASSSGLILAGIVIAVVAICAIAALLLFVPTAKIFAVIAGVIAVAGIVLIILGASGKRKLNTMAASDDSVADESDERIAALLSESKKYDQNIKDKEKTVADYLKHFDIEYYRSDAEKILYSIKSEAAEYRENLKAEKIVSEEINTLSASAKSVCEEIKEAFLKLGISDAEPEIFGENSNLKKKLEEIRKVLSEHAFLSSELEKAEKELEGFVKDNPGIDIEEIPDEGDADGKVAGIDSGLSQIDAELEEKAKEINGYLRRIDDLAGELEELNSKKDELETLSENYSEELHRYGIVKKTEELLCKAKDSLISRYMAPLRCSFEKYYDILKGSDDSSEATDFLIDTNLEIMKKELGNYRDIQTLSDGFADRVGLCMRAAFLDTMYSDEKPIVIMDDPFSNFDEKNLKWGWTFLKLLSEEYQIIYMTCHADRTKEI